MTPYPVRDAPHSSQSERGNVFIAGAVLLAVCALGACDQLPFFNKPVTHETNALVLTPSRLDFGTVTDGRDGAPVPISVRNTGNRAAGPLDVQPPDDALHAFMLSHNACQDAVLQPGEECLLEVLLHGGVAGAHSGAIWVTAPQGIRRSVTLAATSLPQVVLVMDPREAQLPNMEPYRRPPPLPMTVTNVSGAVSKVLQVQVDGTERFGITSDTCSGRLLGARASCTLDANFYGAAAGSYAAYVVLLQDGQEVQRTLLAMRVVSGGRPLTLTPGGGDFGTATSAEPSRRTFLLENHGDQLRGPLVISVDGDADFSVVSAPCANQTLAPGESCELDVRFQPVKDGARSATLRVAQPSGASPTATLRGNGLVPDLVASPAAVDIPDLPLGAEVEREVLITNVGSGTTAPLWVHEVSEDQQHEGDCLGQALEPGEQCHVLLHFKHSGLHSFLDTVVVDGGPSAQLSIPVRSGLAPATQLEILVLHLPGVVPVDTVGGSATVLLKNRGRGSSGVLDLQVAPFGDGAFQGGAVASAPLLGGEERILRVGLLATTLGQRVIRATATSPDGSAAAVDITYFVCAGERLTVAPQPQDDRVLSGERIEKQVVVTNDGCVPNGPLTLALEAGEGFSISRDSCTGTVLPPGGQCLATVALDSTGLPPGVTSTRVTVSSETGSGPGGAPVSFEVLSDRPANLVSTPTELHFAQALVGPGQETGWWYVTNWGDAATRPLVLSVVGLDAASVVVLEDGCSGVRLLPRSGCSVSLRLDRTQSGRLDAALRLHDGARAELLAPILQVAFSPGALVLDPPFLDLGTVTVGQTTPVFAATLSNTSILDVDVPPWSAGGSPVPVFNVWDSCGGRLAPMGSCQVFIQFHPWGAGLQRARLGLLSATLDLEGRGVASRRLTVATNGTLTSSIPLTCNGTSCTGMLDQGFDDVAEVELHPSGAGCLGAQWTGCTQVHDSSCVVRMDGDRNVSAIITRHNCAFITSTQVQAAGLTLDAADAECAARASAAGLPGTYLAWLSSSSQDAKDRFTGARSWMRVDGAPFADALGSLLRDGRMFYPLVLDERGERVTARTPVLTATSSQGTLGLGGLCSGTLGNQLAVQGRPGAGPQWTEVNPWSCDGTASLYCLGVDETAALAPRWTGGNTVFVTQGTYAVAAGGTVADADALCVQEAVRARLPGTFKAVLPTTAQAAADRFPQRNGTWVRPDLVWLDWQPNMVPVENGLGGTPNVCAYGLPCLAPASLVLAGAVSPAEVGTQDGTCDNWSNPDPARQVALADPDAFTVWMGNGPTASCATPFHLLCADTHP